MPFDASFSLIVDYFFAKSFHSMKPSMASYSARPSWSMIFAVPRLRSSPFARTLEDQSLETVLYPFAIGGEKLPYVFGGAHPGSTALPSRFDAVPIPARRLDIATLGNSETNHHWRLTLTSYQLRINRSGEYHEDPKGRQLQRSSEANVTQ